MPEINDVSFVGVVHPEHGPGFDLWVGGGLPPTHAWQTARSFVPPEEIPEVWAGVVRVFRDYGYRRMRNNSAATFIGVPNPPYHYQFNEQVELHPHDVEQAIQQGRLRVKRFRCQPEGVVAVAE